MFFEKKLQMEIEQNKKSLNMNFNDVLKEQLSEMESYKLKLEEKEEEIITCKEINTQGRRELESLNNQIKIEQLKATTLVNELDQKHMSAMLDKDNETKTMKNLIHTIESKLEVAIKENKTKDCFMIQHLTGKATSPQ